MRLPDHILFVLQLLEPFAVVVIGARFVEGDARLEDIHQRVAGVLQGLANQPSEVLELAGVASSHKVAPWVIASASGCVGASVEPSGEVEVFQPFSLVGENTSSDRR